MTKSFLQPVIGLEIHAELNTASKMFCSCRNDSVEAHPNVNVCPVCMGHPGTLPVINKEAVKKVIKTGLALNCRIPEHSKFDRKNYFYPDLPKGYQISQYDAPLCGEGYLDIGDGKRVRITRVHLEEDTGRLIHAGEHSLVDFNRAGVPLMELVTKPDIKSAQEAKKFAQELQLILRYLEVSNADMEKGEMRIEANISLGREGKMGTKVEVKNLNSFRTVERAIEYEIERQAGILESGEKVIQETRGWHDVKQITFSQRGKEEAHDYRYFPEPDLPPLRVGTSEYLDQIRAEIPELPQQRRQRFIEEYKLGPKEAELFVSQKDLGEYYEKVVSELREWIKEQEHRGLYRIEFEKLAKIAANYIVSDLLGLLKGASPAGKDFLISAEDFAELITLIYEGKISSKIAKTVLAEMLQTGADPHHIIEEKQLARVEGQGEIERIVKEAISQNGKAAEDYKKGKAAALQFLVGQVMAKTKGRVDPEAARQLLTKFL